MCLTPDAEMQLAAAMDETGEWLEQHAPEMRRQADVIQLHRRNELEQHVPHPEIDDELRTESWGESLKSTSMVLLPSLLSLGAFYLLVWGASWIK